jgi:hypothetical protein
LFAVHVHVVLPADALSCVSLIVGESLSQLPLFSEYPALQAGETALPVLAAPMVTGPEVAVVQASAVASDTTK